MDQEEQYETPSEAGQGPEKVAAPVVAAPSRVSGRWQRWRPIVTLVLAVVAAGVSSATGDFTSYIGPGRPLDKIVSGGCALVFLVFGVVATFGLAEKSRQALHPRVGQSHAAVVRYATLLVGIVATLVITLELLKIPVGQLVVGGVLTSVLLGIAAQQSLSNLFAGLVLLMSRPFRVGDAIELRAGSLGGQLDGTVTEIGITYVRLETGDTVLSIPNSQVLAAAVGPAPQRPASTGAGPRPAPVRRRGSPRAAEGVPQRSD